MKYWDSSALLPQFVVEEGTATSRQLLNEDDHVVTWMWARAEIVSAIERRTREGSLAPDVRRSTLEWLARVAKDWYEITDTVTVRDEAITLLGRHSLKAADAGHLAAALNVQAKLGESIDFVCFDNQLSKAAEREGFRVLPAKNQKP